MRPGTRHLIEFAWQARRVTKLESYLLSAWKKSRKSVAVHAADPGLARCQGAKVPRCQDSVKFNFELMCCLSQSSQ